MLSGMCSYVHMKPRRLTKLDALQDSIVQFKSAAALMHNLGFKAIIETFQMRYYMMFYLKEHQNYQKSKSDFIK